MSDEAVLDFCKVDSNLDTNPKIRKAGFFGSAVFQFLLRVNRRLRREGTIPLSYADPFYIVDQLRVPGDDALELVGRAIDACVKARLIEIDHDLDVAVIVGWEQDWGMRAPRPVRERVAAHRERQQQKPPTPAVTRVTEERYGNAIRSEETRREESQSLSSGSDIPPELPDPQAIVGADLEAPPEPPPGIPQPGRGRDLRVSLNHDAWRYAALKHAELEGEGLTGSVAWPVMPAGAAMNDLVARTREVLAMNDPPDFGAARALITRRIDVAAAEARRTDVRHLRWFTPTKIFDEKAFWRAIEQTPEQAATPRLPPRGSPPTSHAAEPRKIKTLG